MRAAQGSQQRVDTGETERERECVCAEGHVSRASELCCVALGPALCLSEPERGQKPALCQGPEQRHLDPALGGGNQGSPLPLIPAGLHGGPRVGGRCRFLPSPVHSVSPLHSPSPSLAGGTEPPPSPLLPPTPTPSLSGSPLSHGPKPHEVSGSLEGAAHLPHRQEAGPARRALPPPALRPSRCDLL